ncbi:MAG: hypothetical protein KAT27_08120 [Desulfobacterales bacterium]|nr:hypothetical protein [Desulfobacterales bacterium]
MEINEFLAILQEFLETDSLVPCEVYDFEQVGIGPRMQGLTILMKNGELFNLLCTKAKFSTMAREVRDEAAQAKAVNCGDGYPDGNNHVDGVLSNLSD